MEFRELPNGARMQRPALDSEDLDEGELLLKGEFAERELRSDGGTQAGVTGEGSLVRVWCTGLDASETRLRSVELFDVRFDQADLSNAEWQQVTARRLEVRRCRATGFKVGLVSAQDVVFEDCRLDYALIQVTKAAGSVVFVGSSLRSARLVGDLSGAVFIGCDLDGAEFEATKASDCDLRGCDLAGAHGILSLRGAIIDSTQAASAAVTLATEAGLVVRD